MRTTLRKDRKVELLHSVWLFSRCTRKELEKVATITTPTDAPKGTILARENEAGEEFFIVVDGRATVTRGGQEIAHLGPGSFFGELALLDRGVRVATVTADEDMTLLVMSQREFDRLIEAGMPSVARKMLVVLGERLRTVDALLAPT